MRTFRLAAIALCLAACQPLSQVVQPASQPGASMPDNRLLWGRAASVYQAQAVEGDLKPFGTIALYDAANAVVATGTTDGAGTFSLNPFVSWTPTTNAVYVLELSKRFEGSNEGVALRLRTLVAWNGSQWRSVCGTTATGSGVLINAGTTAIAAIQRLRGLTAENMLGALEPTTGTFVPGGTGIPAADFATVKGLVASTLAANLDPVRGISWSSADGAYLAQLGPKNGNLVFDLRGTPPQPGINPSPIRTRYGTGYAVSSQAGLYLGQFGSYGAAGGSFNNPMDLATDRDGNVYVANFQLHRVDKFDPNDNFLASFGTGGAGNGQFYKITSVAVDPLGNILALDYMNHRVQKLDPNGNFLLGFGEGAIWPPGVPPATASGTPNGWFYQPHYLKLDRGGNVWVADTSNYRVLKFDANGNFVRGIGNGKTWTAATPADPPAYGAGASSFGSATISGPTGLALDSQGNLWVCDRGNHRVQKFDSGGGFLGSYGANGAGNGQFNGPESVAVDPAGNLWVSEYYGHRIQKFDPAFNYLGQISTPGTVGAIPGVFNYPRGMTFDANGNLLVADWNNHRIQRFAPASAALTYSSIGRFNLAAGTIEGWIRPTWSGTTPGTFRLFQVYMNPSGTGDGIGIYKSGSQIRGDFWPHGNSGVGVPGDISSWTPQTDHHVAFTWNSSNVITLYLDGVMMGSKTAAGPIQLLPPLIEVGHASGFEQANAIFSGVRIYDYAKSQAEIRRDVAMVEQE
ncbi:Serine/threonine-protein kinase PknD [compost metagenome]